MARTSGAPAVRGCVARAAAAGVVAGAVTLVLRLQLPAPWDLLGNSFGVWCLVPFLLGRATGGPGAGRLRAAAPVGAAGSTGMDAGYYGALLVLTGRVEGAGEVAFWVVAAAAAGAGMAAAGALSRRPGLGWAALSCLPGAVLVLEVLPAAGLHAFAGATGAVVQRGWAAAGVLLTAALAVRSGAPDARRVLAAATALPLAVLLSGACWSLARPLLALATRH